MGVGYRYLGFAQCALLLRIANLPPAPNDHFLDSLLNSSK